MCSREKENGACTVGVHLCGACVFCFYKIGRYCFGVFEISCMKFVCKTCKKNVVVYLALSVLGWSVKHGWMFVYVYMGYGNRGTGLALYMRNNQL